MKQQVRNKLHGKAGFTLVELIVVIAILGILAGIGTVGYSGYIKKAHQAADTQMIGNVAYALALGNAGAGSGVDGWVLLTKDGATPSDATVEQYLDNMFGESCTGDLKLKYDGWGDNGSGTDISSIIGIVKAQGADAAAAVTGSSFVGNVPQMLGDAQQCTNALARFVAQLGTGEPSTVYGQLRSNLNYLDDVMMRAGLAEEQDDNYHLTDPSNTTNTQLSNAVILAVAQEVGGSGTISTTGTNIANMWSMDDYSSSGMSTLTQAATRYAFFESITQYMDDPTLNTAFENMNNAFAAASSQADVYTAMDQMGLAITTVAENAYAQDPSSAAYQKVDNYFNNQVVQDANAYAAVMNTVSQVKDDYAKADVLGQENLYLTGDIANTVNSYVAAAGGFASLPETVDAGTVMVLYSANDGTAYSVPNITK